MFSFKLRGAYNKMAHLSDKQRWKGVVACSAGNVAILASQEAMLSLAKEITLKGLPTLRVNSRFLRLL